MLTIATFNVNGIRAAVRRGLPAWIEQTAPDVMLLQEVRANEKVLRDLLPGWEIVDVEAAAKGRSGVAIASRVPFAGVRTRLPLPDGAAEPDTDTGRWVEADLALADGRLLTVASAYLHSGTAGTPSMDEKYAHMNRVSARLEHLAAQDLALVAGDINVCHRELDLKNWKGNRKAAGFLPEERAYLDRWYGATAEGGLGLVDLARSVAGEVEGPYTWWSWRGKAFDNDSGWRIDVQMTTPQLAQAATDCWVGRAPSYAERISDHAPVLARYDLTLD
ncbi:exodeoxyribonuclease III [Serinibacter salmoneus]|uniref:Exodeoxyribonuclease-3 n=1 Tax=Serinibacter salmoneus TaxID=556530 RepID=A0A2A9CY31_9MICO|nr:exodeoxyribonuclease III [Serinibacter salmoneus]PFG19046.1 exodeoxyribonuclease-3 [Serinibacter salmoneus]